MTGKNRGTAIFIASACVSLVVLGFLLLAFMLYMKAAQAEAVKQDVVYQKEAYRPEESEILDTVLLGCEQAESLPEFILLLHYDAPEGVLQVVGLPSQTVCERNGRTDTIAGHYDYEGVRGAVNAVSSLLKVDADRYLRTQQPGLSNLTDFLGGVEIDLEEGRSFGDQKLMAGRQILDGRRVSALLFARDAEGRTDPALQAELAALLFRSGFTQPLAERYDSFADAVFYNCETNLSRYDFVARKKGFTQYLENNRLEIRVSVLEGAYDGDSGEFIPDTASVDAIAAALGGGRPSTA